MAFDYIVSGAPIIPAPTQPALLFDKDNDIVYVSTMPTLQHAPAWVPIGTSASISVNSALVSSANLNNTTPAAPGGKVNIIWQRSGNNVSAYADGATPGGSDKQVQFNNAGAFGGSSELLWDRNNTISAISTLNIGNRTDPSFYNNRILTNDLFTGSVPGGSYSGIVSSQTLNLTGDQSANEFASMATTSSFGGDATYGGIFCFDLNVLYNGTGTGAALYGFYSAMNTNPGTTTNALIPLYAGAASAGDCAQINGMFAGVQHSAGTATEAAGARITLDISGVVTELYGVKIDALSLGGGTITRYRGVYVGDVTTGSGTNSDPWSVYSDGGKSFFKDQIVFGTTTGSFLKSGSGTPEASLTAPIGSVWLRTDGGLSNSLYFKESGAGNTGWKAGVVGSTDELSALSSYMTTDAGIAAAQNAICLINRTNPGVNTKRKGLNVYLETAANLSGNTDGLQVNVGVTIDATTITGANHVDGIESSTWVTGTAVSLAQINAVKARIGVVGNAHVQNAVSFLAYLPNVTTGATVDNLTGLELDTPAGGGTVTNITGINASLNTNGVIGVAQAFGGIFGGGTNGASRAAILLDSSNSGVVGSALAWGSPAAITAAIYSGTGSPETVVTANKGSLFLRQDGGAGTTLYVKESGSGNTGWVGK